MQKAHYSDKIKKLRTQRGWSQEQLAGISGVSVRTIQRLEGGSFVSVETLKALSSAFDMDVKEFVDKKESAKEPELDYDFLVRINSGKDLLKVVGAAHGYRFDHDDLENEQEVELVSAFLQNLQDWGDIWSDIEAGGRVEATYHMSTAIKELEENGFWVFGLRKKGKYKFSTAISDKEEIVPLEVATIYVVRSTNPTIIKFPASKESIFAKEEH